MILLCFLAFLLRSDSHLCSSLVNFNTLVPAQPLTKGVLSQCCSEADHRKHIPWFHIGFSLLLFFPLADSLLSPSTEVMRCGTLMLLAMFGVLSLLVSLGSISTAVKATWHRRAELTRGHIKSRRVQ